MTDRPAILYFSRSADGEAAAKQFSRRGCRNKLVASALVQDGLRLSQRSGLPVFHLNEQQQRGQDFGSRLYNAARAVFERGYDQLIIIGNDAPQLRLADIRRAQKAMADNRSVLGRDERGGAYLIGLFSHQCTSEFAGLPWQCEGLGEALQALLLRSTDKNSALLLCEPGTEIVLLRTLKDVNSASDLLLLWLVIRKKVSFLRLFVFSRIERTRYDVPAASLLGQTPPVLRGPPVPA